MTRRGFLAAVLAVLPGCYLTTTAPKEPTWKLLTMESHTRKVLRSGGTIWVRQRDEWMFADVKKKGTPINKSDPRILVTEKGAWIRAE